jgi:hypothetical protein
VGGDRSEGNSSTECNGGSEPGDAIARATNVVVPAVTETVQRWSTSAVQSLAYKNVCKRRSCSEPLYMNELSKDGAPASVGENVEKIIRVENEALRPSSRSGAITDAIGVLLARFHLSFSKS